jgi:hypothetical protein
MTNTSILTGVPVGNAFERLFERSKRRKQRRKHLSNLTVLTDGDT